MIFISEKRGRPVGSKNKSKGNISMPNELTKEEQRIFDILSTFAQKGLVDFSTGSVDNEEIMKSEDQELISLYTELVSTIKNREKGGLPSKVIFKLYNTFSDTDILYKSQEFGKYLLDQGYDVSTVDDADIPKDQMKKLYKDFQSLPPKPEPTVSKPSSDDKRYPWDRKKYTKKTPEQKKQDMVVSLTKYLKDVLKLDDNEIKSRINTLLGSAGTETPNDTEGSQSSDDKGYFGDPTTTLNEQILRDFKRFL